MTKVIYGVIVAATLAALTWLWYWLEGQGWAYQVGGKWQIVATGIDVVRAGWPLIAIGAVLAWTLLSGLAAVGYDKAKHADLHREIERLNAAVEREKSLVESAEIRARAELQHDLDYVEGRRREVDAIFAEAVARERVANEKIAEAEEVTQNAAENVAEFQKRARNATAMLYRKKRKESERW